MAAVNCSECRAEPRSDQPADGPPHGIVIIDNKDFATAGHLPKLDRDPAANKTVRACIRKRPTMVVR
jgi:hypothetical protein